MKKCSYRPKAMLLSLFVVAFLFVFQLSNAATSKPIFLRAKNNPSFAESAVKALEETKIASLLVNGGSLDDVSLTSVALMINDSSVRGSDVLSISKLSLSAETEDGEIALGSFTGNVKNGKKMTFSRLSPVVLQKNGSLVLNVYADLSAYEGGDLQLTLPSKGIQTKGITNKMASKGPMSKVVLPKLKVEK